MARRAGVHQRRGPHGRPADQRTDAAVHELRPQQPDRDAGLARDPAARAPRDRARQPAVVTGGARMSAAARATAAVNAPLGAPLALIMAGGTGGHVFPALALARELRARSWQVVWLGTRRGLEARLVPAEQI